MFIELSALLGDGSALTNMFTLDSSVTLLEKIVRPMLVYAALIIMLRIFGRRELAELNPLDLVVILSLSNTVQNAIIGEDNSLVGGLIGAVALLLINYVFSRLKYSFKPLEKLAEGEPLTLIENGKVDQHALKRELITKSDIDIIAHENGYESAEDIERLVLDTNGSFLVDGKDDIRDATFKKEVLNKISELSKQLEKLNASLQKT